MKTPKRKYSIPIDSLNYPGMRGAFEGEEVPSAHALQCERWKRKNRVKQLKNTIRTLNSKLADTDRARIILRNYLINKRNTYIILSRNAESEESRKNWLAATRDLNLFIALSFTSEEIIAKANGQEPIPHALKLTEEEHAILFSLTEEKFTKQKDSQQ